MFKFFEGLVDPYSDYDQTTIPAKQVYSFLRNYTRPFDRIFVIIIFLTVAVAVSEMLLLFYMGRLIDLLVGSPANVWAEYGVEFIFVAVLILVLRPIVYGLQIIFLNNTIFTNFPTLIRFRAHRYVLGQSIGWFENDFAGRIANRMMQTPNAANEVVFQIFDAMMFALAYVVAGMILLWNSDPRLILPLLLWVIPYVLLLRWVVAKIGIAAEESSDARSAVTARIVDSYTNIHSVKMFDHSNAELNYATEVFETARSKLKNEMRLITIMDVTLTVLNGVLMVGVVGFAVWLWFGSVATVGVVASATALALRLSAMSAWIMWAVSSFFRELGIVQEGMKTIAEPIEMVDVPDAKPLLFSAGKIEIRDLSHHYGRKCGGLDQVSLTIRPGEKVGLVGPSGAGKSTLVKLLLRFYDIEKGQILIDDQDIAQIEQTSLRSFIGMVQQDSSLLHRSVRENISYGRKGSSEEEIIAAAKQARAHDFIMTLEDKDGRKGYDAQVGERGVKLSGGQRQRIAIARIMLKDAPILLLDEATSALDSEVEAAIQESFYHLMEGKTVVAIAHRLSTIAQMDRIIVMENGRIVEDGAHETLLQNSGIYAGLWRRQSGGFLGKE